MRDDPREFDAPRTRRRSRAVIIGRVGFALLSAAVLLIAGYGWANYGNVRWALSTSSATAHATADGSTDILLSGLDSRTDAQGRPLPEEVLQQLRAGENEANLTDTLILVHIPQHGGGATAVSLPRDTYTEIPGHGKHKINSAYGRGKEAAAEHLGGIADPAERERSSADAGRKLLTETVQQLTGVQVDHFAEVNLLGFAQLTEAIGGVPVCLREDVHDSYSGADFRAGPQLISGPQALSFVRQRHGLPRGDLDRMVRQQVFLAGFAHKAISGGLLAQPSKLGALVEQARRSIVLDREWDVLAFAQRMQGIAAGNVQFSTIPIRDAAYETPDGEAVRVDPTEVRRALAASAHGRAAPAQEVDPTGETEGAADPSTGSGETGDSGETGTPQQTATGETGAAEETTGTGTYGTTARPPTAQRESHPRETEQESTSDSSAERTTGATSTARPRTTGSATEPSSTGSGSEQPIAPDSFTAGGPNCVN